MHERRRAWLLSFGTALPAMLIALFSRWELEPVLGDRGLYSTLLPAVIIAAYFGGWWPGLMATVASALAANFFTVEPLFTLNVKGSGDFLALSLFVLTGLVISGLSESLHRAHRRIVADERRRSADALSQERSLLHALMDYLPDRIYFKDSAGRFLRVNKALGASFGLSNPELAIGKTDFDFLTAPAARFAQVDEQEILRTGEPLVGKEEKETWRNGPVSWASSTKMPFRDRDGNIVGTFGVARDITRLKLAEEALRESEQRWRSLTEALPQLVWSARPDGSCDYMSHQWTQHTGLPESSLLDWRWLDSLHPDDREPTQRLWLHSVAGRGPYDVEYRVRRHDGVYRWFKTRGVPIRDGDGKIIQWFGTCTDISDLRQAEAALRESEARFRGTFENAAVGIAHTDLEGRWLRVNKKFGAILGYTVEELTDQQRDRLGWRDLTYPEDLPASTGQLSALVQGERQSYSLEKRYLRKDGSVIWGQLDVSLQRDTAGKPAYLIAVIQDISERKGLDTELRRAKEAAEAANRAKDEFLANVSHEIRTPMNAILGMTELALDTDLTENQWQHLRTVKSAADNLLGIINDLLDFAKIEAGKLELDPTDFSLRAAVGDTVRALAVRAQTKGLELICHVDPAVPEALVGDAGRLRQVLLNLIGNAIKFTDRGKVVVRIEEASGPCQSFGNLQALGVNGPRSPDVCLRFTVSDTGVGISRDKQERIFRAFEQEDASTTRKYGGTGLGLTIASQLVSLMGGQITVDSEPGRGSTFAFTARFGRQSNSPDQRDTTSYIASQPTTAEAPASPAVRRESARDGGSATVPLRILVAEDNEFNAELLQQLLARRGHHVCLATNGREALRMAAAEPFHLLLLDLHMPELDGFRVVQAVREKERSGGTRLPVIALTARSRQEDRERCLAAGMDDFLAKPILAADLWAAIDRVVHARPSGNPTGRRLLDPSVILAACGGDDAILERICQTFRARLPDHLKGVQDASRSGDAPRLREAAHKLAGMVAAFSTTIGGVASDLEDRAAHGQLEEAQALVRQLETTVPELGNLMRGLSIEALRKWA